MRSQTNQSSSIKAIGFDCVDCLAVNRFSSVPKKSNGINQLFLHLISSITDVVKILLDS